MMASFWLSNLQPNYKETTLLCLPATMGSANTAADPIGPRWTQPACKQMHMHGRWHVDTIWQHDNTSLTDNGIRKGMRSARCNVILEHYHWQCYNNVVLSIDYTSCSCPWKLAKIMQCHWNTSWLFAPHNINSADVKNHMCAIITANCCNRPFKPRQQQGQQKTKHA